MRTLLIASLLALSAGALAQEQGQPPTEQQKPPATQDDDAKLKERIRVEGAAGGTAPVPEEKRRAVNANAGPHKHKNLPSPTKLPRDQPVEPPR